MPFFPPTQYTATYDEYQNAEQQRAKRGGRKRQPPKEVRANRMDMDDTDDAVERMHREAEACDDDARAGSKKMMNARPLMLELFAGCGNLAFAFDQYGFNTITLDNASRQPEKSKFSNKHGHIKSDIVKWKYMEEPALAQLGYRPNQISHIHASPPCDSFSRMAASSHKRSASCPSGNFHSKKVECGNRCLYKTLDIIRYFKEQNPALTW
jgi:hypothetical protein